MNLSNRFGLSVYIDGSYVCLLLLKAVVLNKFPLIVAGGDAFVAKYATVDDCIASNYEISKIVQNSL